MDGGPIHPNGKKIGLSGAGDGINVFLDARSTLIKDGSKVKHRSE